MACKGCGGPCPPCPQSVFIDTLDPECPVPVEEDSDFVDVLSRVVPVPAGLPSFGVDVVADLVVVNDEEIDIIVAPRIVDVFEGTTTVLRTLPAIRIVAGDSESIAIIGGLNNLSAGNHTIKLQVFSATEDAVVVGAGMRTSLNQTLTFDVGTPQCVEAPA